MLPGLVISAISLIVILYFVDFGKLIEAMKHANYALLALGACGTLSWILVRSLAWRALLGNLPHYREVFFAVNEGYLLNNLLPFRLGEVGRAFLMGRKPLPTPAEPGFDTAQSASTGFDKLNQPSSLVEPVETASVEPVETRSISSDKLNQPKLGFWRTMSSVVVERVFDMAFGVTVLLISLPFVINVPWAQTAARSTGVIVVIGLLMLYLMGRFPQTVQAIFEQLTAHWAFARRLGSSILPRLLEGLSVFKDWKRFLIVVGWMALNWLIGFVIYWLYLRAFLPDAPLLWASFALGVSAIGGTIPSSPGNVGVLEGAIIGALTIFGVDPTIAFAYAVTLHLVQVIFTAILGIYGLSREGETLLGVYQQVRNRTL
jgi:glycosyltransferase 2 family protein